MAVNTGNGLPAWDFILQPAPARYFQRSVFAAAPAGTGRFLPAVFRTGGQFV